MVLNITDIDILNINSAIAAGGEIWKNDLLTDFKRKIKDYNRYLQSEQCCYCRRSLADEFNMVIDIEHVLPKSQFGQFMFSLLNLSVSCKRCNMEIKKDDISFVVNVSAVNADHTDTNLYKIIHPNLDIYFDHIKYYANTVDDKTIVKYQILNSSTKGEFTYRYFFLSEIERESYNQAQGIKVAEKIAEVIPIKIAKEIQTLLGKR